MSLSVRRSAPAGDANSNSGFDAHDAAFAIHDSRCNLLENKFNAEQKSSPCDPGEEVTLSVCGHQFGSGFPQKHPEVLQNSLHRQRIVHSVGSAVGIAQSKILQPG